VLWVYSHGQKATAVKLSSLSGVLIHKNHPVLFRTKTEVFECHAFFASLPNRQLEVMSTVRTASGWSSVAQRHRKEAHGELTYLVEAA
jgi:hypothetical protein